MDAKAIWQSFLATGDPLCYLLAKKLEQPRSGADKTKAAGPGDSPRPSD